MADQLKTCPHCGSTPVLHTDDEYAMCESCSYDLPVGIWNTRVEPVGVPTVQAGLGWAVRERRSASGDLIDCFVEGPKEGDMAYGLEVLGDDYTGYGDVERKLEHCKMIAQWANAAPSQPVAGKPSDELTFADLQSMYSGQCQLTDELAAKLEAGSDKVLLARIAELESDLAEMNKRYIANTIAKVTPLVPSDEQIMSLWHSRVSSWRLSYAKHEIASICTFARDLLTTTANAGKVDDTEYGWLVENGRDVPDLRYRTMDNSGITWTNDHNKALRFARRADAEMFAAEDEDAWRIVQHAWDNVAPPVDEPVDRYGRTAAQELQRQIDNKLLRLIQQFFPSLPVAPGYTDWAHWLRFANEAAKIHASQPLAEVKP